MPQQQREYAERGNRWRWRRNEQEEKSFDFRLRTCNGWVCVCKRSEPKLASIRSNKRESKHTPNRWANTSHENHNKYLMGMSLLLLILCGFFCCFVQPSCHVVVCVRVCVWPVDSKIGWRKRWQRRWHETMWAQCCVARCCEMVRP